MVTPKIHYVTGLCGIVMLMYGGCRSNPPNSGKPENAVPVGITRVKIAPRDIPLSLSGNVEGNRTVRLGFLVAGRIDFIAAEEGQMVYQGQLLASLEPTSYSIAKEIADAQANQVQDEYNRLKAMYERNSISESDFAKLSFGLQQALAQQKLHTKNLEDTKLHAPFTGVLLKRLAEVGEITGVGIPLFVVSDIRNVKVTAFIPGAELHSIKLGQPAGVTVSSLSGMFQGKVIEVGAAADPSSRAFTVKIEVSNPSLLIRPGMIADVTLKTGQPAGVMTVPLEAVLHDPANLSYVFVADSIRHRAFRRNISLGSILDDGVEITSGLAENEQVVTAGQQKLVDGDRITYE